MSERTTIGGTVYEAVGSSSSNLLLKCNGTARILWGNKLIDLVKNGKIASAESSGNVSIVNSESEIKSEGIYLLSADDNLQLWICKNGHKYNLTGTDLYISANTKQEITAEQRGQALSNIGIYYDTMEDLINSNVLNGIVYVIEDNTLYTIKNGTISEFEAKLKTVAVEQENEQGEVINSSIQVALSVLNDTYLILKDRKILVNYDVVISDQASIMSEGASNSKGYRLYMSGDTSVLEVDSINVRNGILANDYIDVTFEELQQLIDSDSLKLHLWYLVNNYVNPWRIQNLDLEVRPILIRALTSNSFYDTGLLLENQSIQIKYDPTYKESLLIDEQTVMTRGRITWMRDFNGNEASFDFLDYYDSSGNPLTTLHDLGDGIHSSIFPCNSYNNKVNLFNLKGTVITDGAIDDSNTSVIDIQSDSCNMHDNVFECEGLVVTSNCENFSNNYFKRITNCTILASIVGCKFKNLSNCVLNAGSVTNCIFYSDIINYTFSNNGSALYTDSAHKRVYFNNDQLQVFVDSENYFKRGMIIMHSGFESTPEGWAICNGDTYNYYGEEITTPDLRGLFIKAVSSKEEVGVSSGLDVDANNTIKLSTDHLPEHTHAHTHAIPSLTGTTDGSGDLTLSVTGGTFMTSTSSTTEAVVGSVSGEGVSNESKDAVVSVTDSSDAFSGSAVGGNHTHTVTTTENTTGEVISAEADGAWTNTSIKIEPNHYSLIFIMKL